MSIDPNVSLEENEEHGSRKSEDHGSRKEKAWHEQYRMTLIFVVASGCSFFLAACFSSLMLLLPGGGCAYGAALMYIFEDSLR